MLFSDRFYLVVLHQLGSSTYRSVVREFDTYEECKAVELKFNERVKDFEDVVYVSEVCAYDCD